MEKKPAEGLKLLQKFPQHAILYTKYKIQNTEYRRSRAGLKKAVTGGIGTEGTEWSDT